jgi:tRNA(Ile)-lysidine synthase
MTTHDQRAARRTERRVVRFIEERRLIPPGSTVLLAVSGGPDSLALLHLLARTRQQHGAALVAAYVDHGIRPADEIEADRSFVAQQATALDVPFVWSRVVPETDRRRSPEEAARLGRYRALARLATETGADAVATGHTRSDQAETVILRLVRGSGLRGLAAMAPAAPWPVRGERPPPLVRPLLALDRAEVEHYCAVLGLVPRHDPENDNPRYLRNRVRAEILPVLRASNPRIERVLARLADEARDWQATVEGAAAPALDHETDRGRSLSLDADELAGENAVTRLAQLRALLRAALPDRAAPSRAHLAALDRLLLGPSGKGVDLPDGLRAQRRGGELVIERHRPEDARPAILGPERPVPMPGELLIPGWRVSTARTDIHAGRWTAHDRWTVLLAPEAVSSLAVGPRRPGDRIELARMQGRKRVQDLFVDCKVARAERDTWPVFRSDRGIVWVAGLRVAAWAAATGGEAIEVRVERAGPIAPGAP